MNAIDAQAKQDVIRVGQMEIRYLQEAKDGCQLGCFELRVPPGSNVPPPHSHSANEELLYVLEGTLRHTVGSETKDLHPGESSVTPRGVAHGFSNPHSVTARALVILTPDTIGSQYFRDVSAVVNAGGPPDRTKLVAVMQKYGLVSAAPPVTP
jgi:quercetin dioxygenase-like cupin family protein